ncbi:MAG: MerR family transcriptional regulator [Actinomycetota bacterium]|nr:MerR family transcriptional regulator [Actinomycetota bacterium]
MPERAHLSIGEVLSLLREEFPDVTISKIRFLESQGLLDPERTPSGYRKFYEEDVERLRWILRQQRENFLPLKVIKGRLVEQPEGPAVVVEAPAEAVAPTPRTALPTTIAPAPAGGNYTLDELAAATGLSEQAIDELSRFGLIAGRDMGGTAYYDEEAATIAALCAGFARHGVEARHLRMYKNAAERESALFEQIVMPLVKQRNPQARQQAATALEDLGRLSGELRRALLRQALGNAF